jgi:3-hydroxyisobutyrate dehydrogenase-like beta-hydroxyacid dehydrogenase
VVRDADSSRAQQFAKENPNSAVAGEDDEDAWKYVDILVTMLPNGKVVRDVLLGDGGEGAGIARGLKAGEDLDIC